MPFGILEGFDLRQCQIELRSDLPGFPTCLRGASGPAQPSEMMVEKKYKGMGERQFLLAVWQPS
jgi:hypothetical protein